MKPLSLALLTPAFLSCDHLNAQLQTSTRSTHNYTTVNVTRMPNPYYYSGAPTVAVARALDAEQTFPVLYSLTIIHSITEYIYTRNCFDYAWAPYMSCMCNISGPQNEAWWMDVPNANWNDGSIVSAVTSVGRVSGGEYYFRTADLENLRVAYQDVFGNQLELPVCDLNNLSATPQHSTYLVNWFTPVPLSPDYSVGIYNSKWGRWGLYQHRWGRATPLPRTMAQPTCESSRHAQDGAFPLSSIASW